MKVKRQIRIPKIVNAIARRDGCSKNEALANIRPDLDIGKGMILEGNCEEAMDFLGCELGLEPDIIEEFIFQFI